jgi:hypothetical protein
MRNVFGKDEKNHRRETFIKAASSLLENDKYSMSDIQYFEELHNYRKRFNFTDNIIFQLRSEYCSLIKLEKFNPHSMTIPIPKSEIFNHSNC